MRTQFKFLFYLFSISIIVGCTDEEYRTIPIFSCTDGLKNGNETGVDCGGDCVACIEEIDIPTSGYISPIDYDNYTLLWSDEFEDDSLNSSMWNYHIGDGCPNLCGWGNNELQYYTNQESNIFFEEGNLVIKGIQENVNGRNYSSARIHTQNKFEFKYGRIDIRATMPSATGSWIAFWLLNKNYAVQDPDAWWPSGGEIDIMEYLGEDPSEILGTAHYGSDFPMNHRYNSVRYKTTATEKFDETFYVFSIIWEKNQIRWLVNDEEYHSLTPSNTSADNQPYPFNDEFFLILNFSIGGNLPLPPISSEFPDHLIIDYIRVFNKE